MLIALSLTSSLLPIVFFLLFLNRNRGGRLWVIFLYATLSFLTDILASIFRDFNFFDRIFTVIEYSLISIFLYSTYQSIRAKQFIIAGSLIFAGFVIYNLLKGTSKSFDSFPASVESILIISYCMLFFYEQLKSIENNFIYASKKSWIVVAILLYLAATFILFISTAYMSDEEQKSYWPINQTANIVKNVLLTIAFVFKTKQNNNPTLKKTYNI